MIDGNEPSITSQHPSSPKTNPTLNKQGAPEGSQHLRSPQLTSALIDLLANATSVNAHIVARAAGLVSDVVANDPSVVSYVQQSGLAQVCILLGGLGVCVYVCMYI